MYYVILIPCLLVLHERTHPNFSIPSLFGMRPLQLLRLFQRPPIIYIREVLSKQKIKKFHLVRFCNIRYLFTIYWIDCRKCFFADGIHKFVVDEKLENEKKIKKTLVTVTHLSVFDFWCWRGHDVNLNRCEGLGVLFATGTF